MLDRVQLFGAIQLGVATTQAIAVIAHSAVLAGAGLQEFAVVEVLWQRLSDEIALYRHRHQAQRDTAHRRKALDRHA